MRTSLSQRQFNRARGIGRAMARHKWTRAKIAERACKLLAENKHLEANQMWNMIGHEERRKPMNQRQLRKARRAAAGMGCKRAFKGN